MRDWDTEDDAEERYLRRVTKRPPKPKPVYTREEYPEMFDDPPF